MLFGRAKTEGVQNLFTACRWRLACTAVVNTQTDRRRRAATCRPGGDRRPTGSQRFIHATKRRSSLRNRIQS